MGFHYAIKKKRKVLPQQTKTQNDIHHHRHCKQRLLEKGLRTDATARKKGFPKSIELKNARGALFETSYATHSLD
jgi:hypothetical protein